MADGSPIYLSLMMLGGALPDDAPSADKLVTDKGRALLQAARESCTTEMRAVAKKEGITADNAFVQSLGEVGLTRVTDMPVVRLPVPVLLGTGLADSLLVPRRQYGAVASRQGQPQQAFLSMIEPNARVHHRRG